MTAAAVFSALFSIFADVVSVTVSTKVSLLVSTSPPVTVSLSMTDHTTVRCDSFCDISDCTTPDVRLSIVTASRRSRCSTT